MLSQAIHEFLPRKTAKEVWRLASASVAVRNFPLSAEDLRKVLKLKDGNAGYLFGCTLADGRKVVLSAGRSGQATTWTSRKKSPRQPESAARHKSDNLNQRITANHTTFSRERTYVREPMNLCS